MTVTLNYRRAGVHMPARTSIDIPRSRRYYVKKIKTPGNVRGEYDFGVNEERLLSALPKKFLPTEPKNILVTVTTKYGSQGIDRDFNGTGKLTKFKNWAKYFPAYVIELGE